MTVPSGAAAVRGEAVLTSDVLVDAPLRTVAGVLRDVAVSAEALGRCGHRLTAPVLLLAVGDELRVAVRVVPGVRIQVRTRVSEIRETGRNAQGVKLIDLKGAEKLQAIAPVVSKESAEVETEAAAVTPE